MHSKFGGFFVPSGAADTAGTVSDLSDRIWRNQLFRFHVRHDQVPQVLRLTQAFNGLMSDGISANFQRQQTIEPLLLFVLAGRGVLADFPAMPKFLPGAQNSHVMGG